MKPSILFLLFLYLLFFNTTISAQNDLSTDFSKWELRKDHEGVKLYSRTRYIDDDIKEYKASIVVKKNINEVIAFIKNDSLAKLYVNRTKTFKSFDANQDRTQWYVYCVIDIPWPFDNKDLITKNTLNRPSPIKAVISSTSTPKYLPEEKGKARIMHTEASWTMENNEKETVVSYQVYAQKDGILPQWIVDQIVVIGLHDTMVKMNRLLIAYNQ